MAAISFKGVGETEDSETFKSSRTFDLPYGIKTPLEKGVGELFEMTTDMREQIADNLKNLILTNAGDRLGNYSFGANLRSILSENLAKEDFDHQAMIKIKNAVTAYMPYISLSEFEAKKGKIDPITGSASTLISLTYNVNSLGISNKKIIITIQPIS
jgi:phage baseplate assembly protein W